MPVAAGMVKSSVTPSMSCTAVYSLRQISLVGSLGAVVRSVKDLDLQSVRLDPASSAFVAERVEGASSKFFYAPLWHARPLGHAATGRRAPSLPVEVSLGARTTVAVHPPSLAAVASGISLIQAVSSGTLDLRTRSAHPVLPLPIQREASSGVGAGLHALLRTAAMEYPWMSANAADNDMHAPSALALWAVEAGASRAAVIGGVSYVATLSRWSERGASARVARLLPSASPESAGAVSLFPSPRGSFTAVLPRALPATPALPGVLELSVRAVGLNFRDVLNVLGMYPGDPGAPGVDCAGIIVSGAGEAGSAVFGMAPGALGTHVSAVADLLPPKPPALAFEAAASLPTVCVTVDLALRQAAGVHAGAPVLVHAAAGGLGLTAIDALSRIGSRVISSAGSFLKRALVRRRGVEVLNSRDTGFAMASTLLTKGSGCASVLNSLTSAGMIGASVAALSHGAAFADVSKRDIWSPLRMAGERSDVAYSFIATDFLPSSIAGRALTSLGVIVSQGALDPLPCVSHHIGVARDALRLMSHGTHVGKVVLRAAEEAPPGANGLFLGGTGALGSLCAEWAAVHGSKHLRLLGRTGRVGGGLAGHLFFASVTQLRADVGVREEAAHSVARLSGAPALEAILHSGGFLSDATLANQTPASVRAAMAPKATGLENLLAGGAGFAPLASNLLFSSVSSLVGSPGQANYSAANAVLDALAVRLQEAGAVGLSVQWGAWASVGMATLDKDAAGGAHRLGVGVLSVTEGVAALASILHGRSVVENAFVPALAFSAFAFNKLRAVIPQSSKHFLPATLGAAEDALAASHAVLQGSAAAQYPLECEDAFQQKAAVMAVVTEAVCGLLERDVGLNEPLLDAGLDSLGAMELRNALSARLGMSLPSTLVFDCPSVDAIVGWVMSTSGAHPVPEVPQARAALSARESRGPTVAAIVAYASRLSSGRVEAPLADDTIEKVDFTRFDAGSFGGAIGGGGNDGGDGFLSFGAGSNAGCLHDAHLFDNSLFGISAGEALLMDPQQRLLLAEAHQALLTANGSLGRAAYFKMGSYCGISVPDIINVFMQHGVPASGLVGMGSALSVASGRISYSFGLGGPAVSVDTACSSALVAAHLSHADFPFNSTSAIVSAVLVMANHWGSLSFAVSRFIHTPP